MLRFMSVRTAKRRVTAVSIIVVILVLVGCRAGFNSMIRTTPTRLYEHVDLHNTADVHNVRRIHVISFGNTRKYVEIARKNMADLVQQLSGNRWGAHVTVHVYTKDDISRLVERHTEWFRTRPRGFGHWMWKPYILEDALSRVDDGDIVLYMDAGRLTHRALDIVHRAQPFSLVEDAGYTIRYLATAAAMDAVGISATSPLLGHHQVLACLICYRKTSVTVALNGEWLAICERESTIEDHPIMNGNSGHDQVVLSLLAARDGVRVNGLLPSDFRRSHYSSHRSIWTQFVDLLR